MKKKLTEKEFRGLWSFLVETFEFTEEQIDAIHRQIPMTQKLFDSILDRFTEIGEDADRLFYAILDEYPDFMDVRANKIDEEVAEADIPPLSEEMVEEMKQNIYAMIRERYGEDAL